MGIKNILAFWQYLENLEVGDPDRLSHAFVYCCNIFLKSDKRNRLGLPGLLGHLFDQYKMPAAIRSLPVAERQGHAKKMFEVICYPETYGKMRILEINPDELIIGKLPPYSVGQGKELI